nr:hypothetical protein [uncultured Flavobacterium sp.]
MKKYNIDLRSKILMYSIQQEALSSEVIKKFLRISKQDLKTLGNKTSSFSFKNKIDLLFDIGDIEKEEYPFLIKFMEIRNQFIHNPTCSTFLDLKIENNEYTNFLKKNFKNDIVEEEQSLSDSYDELNVFCKQLLIKLDKEYDEGITKEQHRFLNAELENNFESIFSNTINDLKESERFSESDIGFVEFCLKNHREDMILSIFKKISDDEISWKDIYGKR